MHNGCTGKTRNGHKDDNSNLVSPTAGWSQPLLLLTSQKNPSFQVCPWKQDGGEVDGIQLNMSLCASWPMARSIGTVWLWNNIKDVTWCCYSGCVSILLSAVRLSDFTLCISMWCEYNTWSLVQMQLSNLLRKIAESLKMKSFSLVQDVVFCVQTSLAFPYSSVSLDFNKI